MNNIQKRFLKKAIERSDNLTDWERSWLANIERKPGKYNLSNQENKILNQIQRKTSESRRTQSKHKADYSRYY